MMNLSTKNNHNEENEVYHHRIDFPSRTASNSFTTNTLPRTRATHEQLLLINRYVFQPLEHPPASSHNNHGTITTNNQACITSQPNIQNTFKPSTVVKHNRANKKCIPSVPKRKLKPCNDIVFEKSTKIFKFSKTSRPVKSTSNNDQNGFPQISYSSSKQHVSSFAKYKPEQHDTQLLPNQSHFENQKKTKNVFYRPNDGIQQLSTHKVGDKLGVSPVILHPNKQLSSQIQIKSEFPPAQSQRTARAGRRIVTTSLQRSTMESQNDSPIIITPSSHVIHSANEIVTANIVPKPSVPAVSHFSVVNRTGIQKLSANKVADKLGFSPVILRPNKQLTSQIQIKSEFPPAQSHRTALAGSRMVTTLLQRSAMESQNDSPIIITPSSHVIHSANEIVPANIQIKSEFPPARSQRAARAGSRMVTTSLQRSTMESQNDSPIIMTPSSHFIHSANETVPANIQIKSEFPPARSQRTARAGSRMVTTSFQRSTMESQNDSPIIMIPSSQFIHSANEAVPANIQIKSEFPPARSQRAARAGSRMVTTSLQRSTMESQNDSPIIMTPSSHFIHSANETVPANIQIKSEFPPARSQRTARAGSRMVTTSFQRSTMESQNDSPIIMIPSSQFIHSANEAVPANIQIKSEFPPARSQRAARAGSRMVTTSLQRSTMESQNDSPIIMTPSSHFIHSANETVPANIQIKSEFPPAQSQKTARPGSRLVTSFQQSTMESQNDSSILMTPSSHFIYSADEMVPANIQIKSEFPPAQSQKTAQPGSRMVTTAFQRSTMESQNDSPIIMTPSSHFIHSANEIVPANIQIKSEFPPAQSQKTAQPGSRMVTTSFQRSTMESQNDSPIIMIPSSHFIHSANETLPANIVPKPSVPAVSHFSVINNTNVQMIPSIQSTNNVKQLLWYTPASNPAYRMCNPPSHNIPLTQFSPIGNSIKPGIPKLSAHEVGDELGICPVILHPNKQLSSQIQVKSEALIKTIGFAPARSQMTAQAQSRIVTTSLQRSIMESQNVSPLIITPSSHVIHSANEIVPAKIVPIPSAPAVSHFSVINKTGSYDSLPEFTGIRQSLVSGTPPVYTQSDFARFPPKSYHHKNTVINPAVLHGPIPGNIDEPCINIPNSQHVFKPIISPRPSILRKRDADGVLRAQKNLIPLLTKPDIEECQNIDDTSLNRNGYSETGLKIESIMVPQIPEVRLLPQIAALARQSHIMVEISPRKKPRKQLLPVNQEDSPFKIVGDDIEYVNEKLIKIEKSEDFPDDDLMCNDDLLDGDAEDEADDDLDDMDVDDDCPADDYDDDYDDFGNDFGDEFDYMKSEKTFFEDVKTSVEVSDESSACIKPKNKRPTLLGSYKTTWRGQYHHFQRYTDFKIKETKKQLAEMQQAKKWTSDSISGWRVRHLLHQFDGMISIEDEIIASMNDLISHFEATLKDLRQCHHFVELTKDNIQRSKVSKIQLEEIRHQLKKVFDYKTIIEDVVDKYCPKDLKKKFANAKVLNLSKS